MAGSGSPDELSQLRAELAAARDQARAAEVKALIAEAEAARVNAINADLAARNAYLELMNAKMRRATFGPSSESARRLLNQMELEFEELEATATEDELVAQQAAAKTTTVKAFTRQRATRRDFPAHLPVERIVIEAPSACPCCGDARLVRLGEDVTRSLEKIPAQYKIIETVREKYSCRACEKITQAPAPFHVTPRGMFGPHFLASLIFQKYGLHQPLNSQRDRLEQEGIPLSLSTLADQIGACAVVLKPLFQMIEAHVLGAERLHGDDTTVPLLAKYKTDIARIWTYVRDDRPFGGDPPPAALFYYSRDRKGAHARGHLAGYSGILQADNFAGYNALFKPGGSQPPVLHAACWAHARRKFFELADVATQLKRNRRATISPLAMEAVQRIDRVFDIERAINGKPATERLAVRRELAAPLVEELKDWMYEQRGLLSRHDDLAKVIGYMLNDWQGFTNFLRDGRICLTNNAAERELRAIARGRKAWLFVGSDRGGDRAAMMYTLIATARLNDVDPLAWLADVLARIADMPQQRLDELLPWTWKRLSEADAIKQAA